MNPPARQVLAYLPLAGILALSLVLNLSNSGFPLGLHFDEPLKVDFIRTGTQDFHHPLLMLQLVRAARVLVRPASDQQIVVLGRVLMGLAGTMSVLFVWGIARMRLPERWARLAALAVAVSPILVVHAHYLDERTLLATCLLGVTFTFFRFVERPTPAAIVWLGVAVGLAGSSHFEAVVVVPLFAVAPLLGIDQPVAPYFRRLCMAGLVALGVFAVVNWPLVLNISAFIDGVRHGVERAGSGKDVLIRATDYWFGFHLVNSLAPGMSVPTLTLALAATAAAIVTWRQVDFQIRWIVLASLVLYAAVEAPPFKPWPDVSGYVIPVVPFLLCLASWGGARLAAIRALPSAAIVCVLMVVLVGWPLYASTRLVIGLASDTRARAAAWMDANPGRMLIERYAGLPSTENVRSAAELDAGELARRGIEYVLTSSFMYERFSVGSRLPNQDPSVYLAQRRYEALFAYPFIEIAPAYRSLAFSNPTIRIIDIRPASERRARPVRDVPPAR